MSQVTLDEVRLHPKVAIRHQQQSDVTGLQVFAGIRNLADPAGHGCTDLRVLQIELGARDRRPGRTQPRVVVDGQRSVAAQGRGNPFEFLAERRDPLSGGGHPVLHLVELRLGSEVFAGEVEQAPALAQRVIEIGAGQRGAGLDLPIFGLQGRQLRGHGIALGPGPVHRHPKRRRIQA